MSTCGPGHLPPPTGDSRKDIPELFFVATAIKACYGTLPRWKESSERTAQPRDDESSREKRPRLHGQRDSAALREQHCDAIDVEYRQLYCELRNKALSDIKGLVREYVEARSTTSASYDFMNIYGMCSFDPPNVMRTPQVKGEPLVCKFTKMTCPEEDSISVSGILSPLLSARVEHGELELTLCGESDYRRATEEFARLDSRSKMRVPKVYKGNLGATMSSIENRFIFTVRKDLHTLGCLYRQIVVIVELLHLNTLHFIHS